MGGWAGGRVTGWTGVGFGSGRRVRPLLGTMPSTSRLEAGQSTARPRPNWDGFMVAFFRRGWKPKFHYFEHYLDRLLVERLHPRLFWNYGEESVIGDAINIASRTHRLTAPERTLCRYYIWLMLKLLHRDKTRKGCPHWLRGTILRN